MRWLEFLYEQLELNYTYKKIIIDKFGFITDKIFSDFLKEKDIRYCIVSNENELFNKKQSFENIFIITNFNIPYAIQNKYEIKIIDENFFPFKIASEVIQNTHKSELRKIIGYIIENLDYQYVDNTNIAKIKKEAEKFFLKHENEYLEREIDKLLTNIGTCDDLIKLSILYATLVRNSFIGDFLISKRITEKIDSVTFNAILYDNIYKEAFYSPTSNFKTINKVISYIKTKEKYEKFALICFDGMGVTEWNILKYLIRKLNAKITENFIFSLIPTTTVISRASLFSGKIEKCFEININEDSEFQNNFPNRYVKTFREGDIVSEENLLGVDIVKIVYNTFDNIAHGMQISPAKPDKTAYLETCKKYILNSSILEEMKILIDCNYKVYITADHGCVVSQGNGVKIDKHLIDAKCKRAVISSDNELIKKYSQSVFLYTPPFVENKKILIAKNRESFSNKGKLEITHGGITLEEMIVPFVEVSL